MKVNVEDSPASACFETAVQAAGDLPALEHLVQIDGEEMLEGANATIHSLKLTEGDDLPPTPVASNATLCLPYSSGTTGLPKGTMLPDLEVKLLLLDEIGEYK